MNRPAWQPMTVLARREPRGVTVFGTTLTRRQTIAGGVILLVVALLLALVVPVALAGGETDDNRDGAPTAGVPVAAPSGGDPSAGTAAATTAAPAAPAPTTTASPSSVPPPTTASAQAPTGAAVELPAGWRLHEDPTGFSVPVPDGWRVSRLRTEVYFDDDTPAGRQLIVDQTRRPRPDPVADWREKEAERRDGYRNYEVVGIRPVDYWDKAADWEYLRTSDRGNRLHVVKRGFITAKDQAYGITWSTSAARWDAGKADLALIYRGFEPARR